VETSRTPKIGGWIAVPVGILLIIAIGAVLSPRFLSISNFSNILLSMSIVGVIVVEMTFVFISNGMADLSVPATLATGAIIVLRAQPVLALAP
jgi:ribose/xylose/arabinose/galactoside ABC-type transport system permease subunit